MRRGAASSARTGDVSTPRKNEAVKTAVELTPKIMKRNPSTFGAKTPGTAECKCPTRIKRIIWVRLLLDLIGPLDLLRIG